jgi:hypothetical protein
VNYLEKGPGSLQAVKASSAQTGDRGRGAIRAATVVAVGAAREGRSKGQTTMLLAMSWETLAGGGDWHLGRRDALSWPRTLSPGTQRKAGVFQMNPVKSLAIGALVSAAVCGTASAADGFVPDKCSHTPKPK